MKEKVDVKKLREAFSYANMPGTAKLVEFLAQKESARDPVLSLSISPSSMLGRIVLGGKGLTPLQALAQFSRYLDDYGQEQINSFDEQCAEVASAVSDGAKNQRITSDAQF